MKLFNTLRRSPEEKIDDMYWTVIRRAHRSQTVLEDTIHASVLAATHTADRVDGPMITNDHRLNHETNYGDWLQTVDDVDKITSVGTRVGFIVGNQLLRNLSPEAVLAIKAPECDRGL